MANDLKQRLRVFGCMSDKYCRAITGEAADRIEQLEQHRDELLSALKELNSASARGFLYDDPARVKARKAIASVKAQENVSHP